MNLAIDTGARRGELCGLQWSDIDWKKATVRICRNAQYAAGHGVYVTTPKNDKARTVDIGQETLRLLKSLRSQQAEICISKWIFSSEGSSEPMSPQSVTRYFKRFGERHGLKNFHPHLLRHSSASIAITNGADVCSVSSRLGHSDTSTTLRMYTHANEESIRRAGQVVRDAIEKQNSAEEKQA